MLRVLVTGLRRKGGNMGTGSLESARDRLLSKARSSFEKIDINGYKIQVGETAADFEQIYEALGVGFPRQSRYGTTCRLQVCFRSS